MMEKYLLSEFTSVSKKWDFNNATHLEDYSKVLELSKETFEHSVFYPQSFRQSFLSQLMSIFEHELKAICIAHHEENNTDYSIIDLKGNSDIEKAKIYLTKSCKISFQNLDPEWTFLSTIWKIRNLIVHQQNAITQEHQHWNTIFNYIKLNKSKIGFLNEAENLSSSKFKEDYTKETIFNIDIKSLALNHEIIDNIKQFFFKLANELNIKK
jgi:hypothetical protein